jgi:HTH-type transcriptional regulator/antitoxin MqsA
MIPTQLVCPVCETGELVLKQGQGDYHYRGQEFSLADIEYAECPACQFEVILSDQSDRNEARIRDEQRRIDGLLTRAELTQLRQYFHLTPTQAAQVFGDPAFAKYESGEETQSVTLNKLLKLAVAIPSCFEELCKMVEINRPSVTT